ncbi:MAG: ATP-binding protein, partial [Candidatus Hadarchaeales archaeon]
MFWKRKHEELEDGTLGRRIQELFDIKEEPDFTEQTPNVMKEYDSYCLIPRISSQDVDINLLGDRFSIVYEKSNEEVFIYLITPLSPDSLRVAFEIRKALPKYRNFAAELYSKKDWLLNDYVFKDTLGVVEKLPNGASLIFSVSKAHELLKYLHRKKSFLETRARKTGKVSAELSILSKRIEDENYFARICVLADSQDMLKKALEIVILSIPQVKVKKRQIKDPDSFYRFLLPYEKVKIMGIGKKPLLVSANSLRNSALFPNPSAHKTLLARGVYIPVSNRRKENGFRIGVLENGHEFLLSPEDLYRHAYVVGQTGSGKTNLLKILVSKLQNYPVFVIDPHGSMADELAETLDNPIYLSPTRSPFGLNPLKLPPIPDREQAQLITTDVLMNLFTNVFNLPETAINVRYILHTVTTELYKTGAEPTLAAIYKIVRDIYNGADVGISDRDFREHEKLLRNMPDQSFISTLGRLQNFAENSLLRRITSSTTIDFNSLIEERRPVLFSIPQSEIGITASSLLSASLLLNLYYTVLVRHRQGRRDHVFVVIDEFQTLQSLPILATILSEARKFGLHLIVAHQYLEQLSENVFQAAINNSGAKFIFNVTGDAQKLRVVDPAFGEEVVKTITSLPTGKCLVKISTSPEDTEMPPFLIKIDEYTRQKLRPIEAVCTRKYEPKDIELSMEVINPIFKYMDLPFPPKQRILHALHRAGGEESAQIIHAHVSYLKDLSYNKILNILAAEGYLQIMKKGKGERVLRMTGKFFEDFEKVSRSEKGRKLARIALLWYLDKNFYVAPTKNVPVPRPDFIVIPYINQYTLDYTQAVEVEIEATTAEKKEERIMETMTKETPLKERHVWCFEEDYATVAKYLDKANKKTKIMVVRGDRIDIVESITDKTVEEKEGEEKTEEKDEELLDREDSSKTPVSAESQPLDAKKVEIEKPPEDKSPKAGSTDLGHIIVLVGAKKIYELKKRGLLNKFIEEASQLEGLSAEALTKIADRLLNPEPEYMSQLREFCPAELLDAAAKIVEK